MDAVVRWAYGQGSARARRDDRSAAPAIGARRRGAARGRPRRVRRAARVRAPGRPHALVDRGDRPGSAARLPVHARAPLGQRACEITPDELLDQPRDAVPDRRRQGLEAAATDLPRAAVGDRRPRLRARDARAAAGSTLPLLLCLDEAGNVAPLPNLAEIASTAPSHNIQLVSIFHDLAQARSRYGRQAETVVNSHRARMLLPGVADLDTLRYFAGLAGEEEARDLTRTTGAGGRRDAHELGPPPAADRAPRRCASCPRATRCCCTAGCRRPGSRCGCGSPIGDCDGWPRHELRRAEDPRHDEQWDEDDGVAGR